MRALRYHGNNDLRLDEIPFPGPPKSDEIQVRPEWCGICGTDVHELISGPFVVPASPHKLTGCCVPITFGHEAAGVVVDVGSSVSTHKPGDKVCKLAIWSRLISY